MDRYPWEEIANEVFPLERAVTPFSEYKLRLGIVAWSSWLFSWIETMG